MLRKSKFMLYCCTNAYGLKNCVCDYWSIKVCSDERRKRGLMKDGECKLQRRYESHLSSQWGRRADIHGS